MKHYTHLLFLLFLALSLASCNSAGVKKGTEIPADIKREVYEKTKLVHKALKERNTFSLQYIMHDSLKANVRNIHSFDSLLAFQPIDTTAPLSMIGEYYVNNTADLKINYVTSSVGPYDFLFAFKPVYRQAYIYLYSIPDSSHKVEYSVATVFQHTGSKWILTYMYFGILRYDKDFAVDIYKLANNEYARRHLVPSALHAFLAMQLAYPMGNAFHYDYEPYITELYKNASENMTGLYHFPFMVNTVSTMPTILAMAVVYRYGHIYPLLHYKSAIDLSESTALEKENIALHSHIQDMFPYIEEAGDSIVYTVYNRYGATTGGSYSTFVRPLVQ